MYRLALLGLLAGAAHAQSRVQVAPQEAASHRLSDSTISVPIPGISGEVAFEIRVNQLGEVVDARTLYGRNEYVEAAEKAVRSWQFRPFLRGGEPVEAITRVGVVVKAAPFEPTVHNIFPEVQDWSTVRFKLARTSCFGACPAYELEIQGDGIVTYTGRRDVAVTGTHRGSVSRELIESLMTGFREADFFSLNPRYALTTTDGSTYTISISVDGQQHTVEDYFGLEAGMPPMVETLERAIDWYAGADKWTRGNADTVPALRAEDFDFRSREAGRILAHAARRGNADAVRALIQSGAPLEVPDTVGIGFAGALTPLQGASRNPDPEVKRLLTEAGASN